MKFSSFGSIALTCFLTTVSAKIELAAPANPISGGKATVTWTHDASDPAQFILMLQLASDSWATGQFWEFVNTKNDKLDVVFSNNWPYVISTKSIYRLTARNQSNVDQVYSRSPTFQFRAAGSTSTTTIGSTVTKSTTTKSTTPTATSQNSTSGSPNYTSTTTATTSATTSSTTKTSATAPPAIQPTSISTPLTSTPTTTNPTSQAATPSGEGAGGNVLGNNNSAASLSGPGWVFRVMLTLLAAALAQPFM